MNAQFKQSVIIDGHRFPIHQNGAPRVHQVSAKVAKHPHFKHFVKAGLIVNADKLADAPAPESIDERNLRLAAKIKGQQFAVQKVESEPEDEMIEETAFDADEQDFDADADGDDITEDFSDEEPEEVEEEIEEEPEMKAAPKKAKSKAKKRKR